MRLLSLLALLCLSCNACSPTPHVGSIYASSEDAYEYQGTVRVTMQCANRFSIGSGFVTRFDRVITAKHVVACENALRVVEVTTTEGVHIPVVRVIEHEKADAALLVLLTSAKHILTPMYYLPPIGSVACSIGGDEAVGFKRKCGEVFEVQTTGIFFDVHSVPGNSGGPVLYHGFVVGILVRGRWKIDSEWAAMGLPTREWGSLLDD